MNIALIGASGNIGSKILAEALSRGHSVTAIVRNTDALPTHDRLSARKGDVGDEAGLSALLTGHDAVISSLHFSAFDPDSLLAAIKASGVKRYIAVGGAGSLELKPGLRLVDSEEFPAEWKPEARKGVDYLARLRREQDLDWTFISPSIMIEPGKRTGTFRLGDDTVLFAPDGSSRISQEDYAIALMDELENPAHIRQRFTVGY
ncbi:NAD(P)-dependent oxidoreductase [Micavibrio aeruginosavorus]|uniref:NAD-dependent epimerase/dehydratase n=1 Tax=Micavibrio aeruginosavorus (strain ARL-13) TaxID=856793 RepID=G2KQA3_MICAA|nr:NAD(P)-dependent oxidoreductase [Micavibrio aeruginosavorus]AEP08645.1 NAD-dependent epimerase/dehydratase [Micavibrio aeruginosavorus ARL-13]